MTRLLIFRDRLTGQEIARWHSDFVPQIGDTFTVHYQQRLITARDFDTTAETFGEMVTLQCGFPISAK